VYIADIGNQRIREVFASGVIGSIAGNGSRGYSGDGGSSVQAKFYDPESIAVVACAAPFCNGVSEGTVYVADEDNNVIRKLTPKALLADQGVGDMRRN
jgi:hypothetical protein